MKRAPELSPEHSESLHRLRGVLALTVLINHVRQEWWVPFDDLTAGERSLAVQGLYFLTAFGPAAVTVFFVLSGYLITRKYIPPILQGNLGAARFLSARAVRLYLVLLPALGLTFLLSVLRGVERGVDVITGLGNVAFLMPNVVPVFAENLPLWSLGFEGRAYLVFFLIASSIYAQRQKMWGRLALQSCAVVGLLVLGGIWNLHYFGLWGLGALAALGERKAESLKSPRCVWWFAGSSTVAAMVAARLGVPSPLREWMIGVPAAVFFALGARASCHATKVRAPWGKPLSAMSYSLYLTHFPLLVAVQDLRPGLLRPGAESWALFFGGCMGSLLVAWLFFQVTERHTGSVQRWTRRLWGGLERHDEARHP